MVTQWIDFSIAVRQHGQGFALQAYNGLPTEDAKLVATEHQTWPEPRRLEMALRGLRYDQPCAEALAALGNCGAEWLLKGKIRDAFFQQLHDISQDAQKRLRLRLCFEQASLDTVLTSPEFRHLYWEALHIPEWGTIPGLHRPFLALNSHVTVVRHVLGVNSRPRPAVAGPIRVLVVHCNSRRRPSRRLNDMLDALLEALGPLCGEGLVECPTEFILRDPSPEEFLKKLEAVNPHVLVTMCHGERLRSGAGFVLSDGGGGEKLLLAQQIAQTLQEMKKPRLRLAFMPHCHTMGAAPALLGAGVPVVLGMQEVLADRLVTVTLVDQLIRSVAGFKPLDESLIDVRERLAGAFGEGNAHWCFPTLWLSGVSSDIFATREELRTGRYLRGVLRSHSRMPVFGHEGAVPLDRHYIDTGTQRELLNPAPQQLSSGKADSGQPIQDWLKAHDRVIREVEDVSLFKALNNRKTAADEKRYFIWGCPGAGKTTTLRQLVRRFAQRALRGRGRIPAFLELHAVGEHLAMRGDDPNAALLAIIGRQLQPLSDPVRLLRTGGIALFFDGMDEVLETRRVAGQEIALRQRVCKTLMWLANQYHQCPIVITSREREAPDGLSGFTALELKPLHGAQILAYAETYFAHFPPPPGEDSANASLEARRFLSALDHNASLRAMAATPLVLSLICYLYRLEGLPLPGGQTRLYDRATLHLLRTNVGRAE